VHALEVSREHQLPDPQPADQLHLHAREQADYSNIEVVSWQYAWNEDTPGAEIAGTKGKVAAMPAAVQERLIRIWASPQGAPKSALAGTMNTWTLGANPGTVIADGATKAGNTSCRGTPRASRW
jgi:hypothetical protein